MRLERRFLSTILVLLLAGILAPPGTRSQDQPAQTPDQSQQGQDQGQKDQQQKKKKGGFFGGLKAVTGESSQQTEATATAGSKSVGEGQKIGEVTPTPADRQKVSEMEEYSIPDKDLKKFQDDGQLRPQK